MFMLAATQSRRRDSYFCRVTRGGKESAGIQLPPLAKKGTPLTANRKLLPHSSSFCSRTRVRNPILLAIESRSLPFWYKSILTVVRFCAPIPAGHHRSGLMMMKDFSLKLDPGLILTDSL